VAVVEAGSVTPVTVVVVVNVVVPRKMSSSPLVSLVTKLFEKERNPIVWPSALSEGRRLAPFDGEGLAPCEMLAIARLGVQVVTMERHVLRAKMFSTPFVVLAKFEASEENATICASALTLGCELAPFPGVVPSAVDTNIVEGVQVLSIDEVETPMQVSRT
jgi:hypothetical protein